MPYAYGLKAFALDTRLDPSGDYEKATPTPLAQGATPVAYLAPWQGTRDAAFLAALLNKKIRVRYAEYPFTVEGKSYPAGTLMITKGGNEWVANFDQTVRDAAAQHGIQLNKAKTLVPQPFA
jgi:hypothetical protein